MHTCTFIYNDISHKLFARLPARFIRYTVCFGELSYPPPPTSLPFPWQQNSVSVTMVWRGADRVPRASQADPAGPTAELLTRILLNAGLDPIRIGQLKLSLLQRQSPYCTNCTLQCDPK